MIVMALVACLAMEPEAVPEIEECVEACLADDEDRVPLSEVECVQICNEPEDEGMEEE